MPSDPLRSIDKGSALILFSNTITLVVSASEVGPPASNIASRTVILSVY